MNLGILLPRSKVYPGIALEFADGLKTFLNQYQLQDEVRLFTENIGFGGVEKEVYEKAEKLLLTDNADVLLSFIDLKIEPLLVPLLYSSGKLMIVVNAGANYPTNWVAQPNTVYLTLQHAFLCWLTGSLAKGNGVMASTFYDCGYLHTSAMVKGFMRQGGTITYNYINNQPYEQFEIKALTDFLSSDPSTKNLLCVFDTHPAGLFFQLLNDYEDAEHVHVFGSPMMLLQKTFENVHGPLKFAVDGYLPWLVSLENTANQHFTKVYHQQTQKQPTVFSLLGWETGLILQQLIQTRHNDYNEGSELVEKLKLVTLESPRGELQLDPFSNYFTAPAYRCSYNSGLPQMKIENDGSEEKWNLFTQEKAEGVSSGWTNTYLCY